ncbi:MAG: hypothetical protein K0M46_05520 [Thiobacillus sp.]|nr:hypothetical protein [Thiobacillus sp.]
MTYKNKNKSVVTQVVQGSGPNMKFGHAACPPHLLLRSGIDYFRIVVAERLRPAFCCRSEFRISLFTRDQKVALQKVWFLPL